MGRKLRRDFEPEYREEASETAAMSRVRQEGSIQKGVVVVVVVIMVVGVAAVVIVNLIKA